MCHSDSEAFYTMPCGCSRSKQRIGSQRSAKQPRGGARSANMRGTVKKSKPLRPLRAVKWGDGLGAGRVKSHTTRLGSRG